MHESARSLKVAAWLGWQIESNWTEPFLFLTYSILKPVASALILVFMYLVISQGNFNNPLFAYIYVGNAFFIYVGAVLLGVSNTIVDDREHYGMLKYIYVSPIQVYFYLLGRGMAKTMTATIAVVITLAFGAIALGVRPDFFTIDWPLLIITLTVGLAGLGFMGILLAGILLITARHNDIVGEAVAGALYLLCGAVFPISVMPDWLQWAGRAIPITYWLEGLRRALLGTELVQKLHTGLEDFSTPTILLILLGSTLLAILLSIGFYRWCERRAKEKGLIDMQTMY
ncbi:ABC transporter permease [Candidatus Acetothermia bacterium]|nr:ABC transporter permease [Candidatus Acetothermia bacterium]MBI3459633.1 ABC transporter permease [Candidatus Acetothermia bacterium]